VTDIVSPLRVSPTLQPFVSGSEAPSNPVPGGVRTRTVLTNQGQPNLIRESTPESDQPLSGDETDLLLRQLTPRDVAILTALSQYRYLDQAQVQQLFFPSPRSTQLRTAWLKVQGLILRWQRLGPQSWRRHPSVLLLSVRGAGLLSALRAQDPRPAVRRSQHAQANCFHLTHDLEANGFFVAVAGASAPLQGEGLYHWVGEWSSHLAYKERGAAFAPDGWGRYLSPTGEVVLLLEWDRGTESPQRLGVKVSEYVRYFERRREAEMNNVIFVASTPVREGVIQSVIDRRLPSGTRPCCRFWLTSVDRLQEEGPLAAIWSPVGGGPDRLPLAGLPARPRSERSAADSIGKRHWWERRIGGGEGA
jgi:hypothetical protein